MILSTVDDRLRLTHFGLNLSAKRLLPKLVLGHKYVKDQDEPEHIKVMVLMYDGRNLEPSR